MLIGLWIAANLAQAQPAFVTGVQDTYPSASPDGVRLVFQSNRSGRIALYTAAVDGSEVRVLIDSGDDPVSPSWSPQGDLIAFAATVDGQSEVFVVRADGSERRRLTDDPGDDAHPHWSPDGRLFFNSARATPDRSAEWSRQWHDIYSMDSDGGALRRHTTCESVCTFPQASPDGRWLAYRKVVDGSARNWDQSEGGRNSEIFVSAVDGSGAVNVSNSPAYDGWPAWSPDSRWIVFASNRDAPARVGRIWAVRPDGDGLRAIGTDDWSNVQPSFAPDGQSILTYRHIDLGPTEYGFIGRWTVPSGLD